jgi:hypothetical protein
MEKVAENDLTYFYLRHVVIVVTAVTHVPRSVYHQWYIIVYVNYAALRGM